MDQDSPPDLTPPDWLPDEPPPGDDLAAWLAGEALPEPPPLPMPPEPEAAPDPVLEEPPLPELPVPELPVLKAEEPPTPSPQSAVLSTQYSVLSTPAAPPPVPPIAAAPPPASPPAAPRSFVRVIDDDTQEAASAPRTTARQRVPIRSTGPGRPAVYGIVVRNSRERPLHAVLVEHELPLGLRFLAADPPARRRGRRLVWALPSLGPGASQAIRLRVAPTKDAPDRPGLATFDISHIPSAGLLLTITGPTHMRLGQEGALRLRVLNAGEQVASTPLLFCRLSATTPGAKVELLEARLGPLAPGQSKVVNLNTRVRKRGTLQCLATVIAAGWPEVTTRFEVRTDFGAAMGKAGRGRTAEDAGRAERRAAGVRHLLFGLAGDEYAVPLDRVAEVGRVPPWTPVPNVPDWVLGVAGLRGEVLSLVDLRGFLGLSPTEAPEQSRLMVLRAGSPELATALVVDQVIGMRSLGRLTEGPGPDDPLSAYAGGVAGADGRRWTVLDPERLLLSPGMRQFEK